MTEAEFHAARRMFVVKNGTVLIAPAGCPLTHVEWLSDLFGIELAGMMIEKNVRGYALNGRMVVYVGDFSHRVNHHDAVAALEVIEKLMPISEIGFGAVYGKEQPWEPKTTTEPNTYRERVKSHG